ncbi:hypothetical protein BEWA_028100 [Theileria equi strain WA]|uniref:Uncharacterized protein n=1 Tax=Theileria equi strain WA TaxID=1537102 RepID=L0AY83_THEEQ|nr:hypothetical protein BEWA_028100 [Theileria equi strain WA]AFZ79961.1 hypothetical protein BEWA_028100 [Theileria equi strain WA]|eukprot:XP_004829627.1 hypothetical protein BEWA_028100 [Theileria equi strain WA]
MIQFMQISGILSRLSGLCSSSLSQNSLRGISTSKFLLWSRNPGARYPSKANHGARPDCRSLRKIRKRLRTGK